MRHLVVTGLAVLFCAGALVAGQAGPPTAKPGELATPAWRGVITLVDGRRLVTDGGMAIDITLAKPAATPTADLSGAAKAMEGYMAGPYTSEFGPNDISAGSRPGTYAGPNGIALNATYINLLRNNVPVARLRFGLKGPRDPIVILVGGAPAGVLMPLAGPR